MGTAADAGTARAALADKLTGLRAVHEVERIVLLQLRTVLQDAVVGNTTLVGHDGIALIIDVQDGVVHHETRPLTAAKGWCAVAGGQRVGGAVGQEEVE